MNIEIANRLVELRKENNLSQEALAEKLGVSRQAVSKWERAEASPDTDNLIMLAKLYRISLDELLQINVAENGGQYMTSGTALIGQYAESGSDTDGGAGSVVWDSVTENVGDSDRDTGDTGADADRGEGQATDYDSCKDSGKDEYVHVGLGGIHVKDKDGEVHVGWDGIHVDERDGDNVHNVHIDKNGVYVDGEKKEKHWFTHNHFPVTMTIIIVYLLIGCVANAWHPGWLLFLLIPIWESILEAMRKKSAKYFAYPVLATLFFLCTGIFRGLWHPGWVWFVTIPLYYSLVNYFEGRGEKNEEY